MSEGNSAAEFVWLLHECREGDDFNFEGKRGQGLMRGERDGVFYVR